MPPRPLTVLQLVPSLVSGGVERGTLEVAAELVRRGHRSLVVSGGGRLVGPLVNAGSEHISCPIGLKSPWTLRHVGTLRKLMVARQVDVVHARSRVPAWIGWLAWKSLPSGHRLRFVTTVHGLHSVNRFSEIMTRGEAVIAVSNSVREYLVSGFPRLDPQRIQVIDRGVDPREFPHGFRPGRDWRSRWEAEFPQLAGKPLVTLPGRLTRLKGHLEFLRLIRELKDRGQVVHGLIVGDEDPRRREYAQTVREQVRELGLSADITICGHRADIREVYAASSVVLSLSSKPESFGRTTLEALSLGVPVVGYDHGGVGEILQSLYPAGAVPVGDQRWLRQTVQAVLRRAVPPVTRVDRYRLQDMLAQTIALYETLAADGSLTSARAA